MRRFKKILVANRGEIAVRVIRACREMEIASVAVFSEADRAARHVRLADEALPVGPAPAVDSYLRIDRVIEAARASGAEAIHPGYGFLAENAAFARSCEEAGLVFIGPRSQTIALMGEKTSARRLAVEADLASAAARARSEARSAFGDDRVYIERALSRPRHVEIQVVADHHGNAVHLFERECSIQRRHQKVVEESPSPLVTPALRSRMGALAIDLVRKAGYVNAGTLEFLVDETRAPYFLEMNTRLQVEHPVTELVTGVDLVKLQIRIAQGEALPFRQEDLSQRGHAIECRVYAEDPDAGFLPSPGRILALRVPGGPGIRDDSGVEEGDEVPSHYDPLVSKLVAWGEDRPAAIARLRRAVREYQVLGIKTTLPFFERVLRHPDFVAGAIDTSFVERLGRDPHAAAERPRRVAVVAAAIRAYQQRRAVKSAAGAAPAPSVWRHEGRIEAQGGRG